MYLHFIKSLTGGGDSDSDSEPDSDSKEENNRRMLRGVEVFLRSLKNDEDEDEEEEGSDEENKNSKLGDWVELSLVALNVSSRVV